MTLGFLGAPALRRQRWLVVDADVADADILLAGAAPDTHVLRLLPGEGLARIAAEAARSGPIDELHLVAHGRPGSVLLGGGEISAETWQAHASLIRVASFRARGRHLAAVVVRRHWRAIAEMHCSRGSKPPPGARRRGAGRDRGCGAWRGVDARGWLGRVGAAGRPGRTGRLAARADAVPTRDIRRARRVQGEGDDGATILQFFVTRSGDFEQIQAAVTVNVKRYRLGGPNHSESTPKEDFVGGVNCRSFSP